MDSLPQPHLPHHHQSRHRRLLSFWYHLWAPPPGSKYPHLRPLLLALFIPPTLTLIISWLLRTPQPPSYSLSSPSTPEPTSQFATLLTSASPTPSPLPKSFELPAATWVPQTFNNCVPATVSMLLQYYGYHVDQVTTKAALRTNPDDKNVFPEEIVTYLDTEYGLKSKVLYNGDIDTLKHLVANNIYVVIEAWLHPNEDIGHVLIIRGYDDSRGVLIGDDSYINVGVTYPYEQFTHTQWRAFNHEYIPVYRLEQESLVQSIIGANWDPGSMYQHSITTNLHLTQADTADVYDWFNLGTSYFGAGELELAQQAFNTAHQLKWPGRMLWYQIQPIQTFNLLGDYQGALTLIRQGLQDNDTFAELHLEAARAYSGLGDSVQAQTELNRAASLDSRFSPVTLADLPTYHLGLTPSIANY